MNIFKEKLNQIKLLLNLETEVKLSQETLIDNTIIEAESFQPGFPMYIVGAEETVLATKGVYETSDKTITVDEEGNIITVEDKVVEEVKETELETEVKETEPETEVKAELETEIKTELETEVKEEVDFKEALITIVLSIETLNEEMVSIKTDMVSFKEKYAKLSAEPAAVKYPNITKSSASLSKEDLLEAKIEALKGFKR